MALTPEDSVAAVSRLHHKLPNKSQLILAIGRREYGKTYAINTYLEQGEPRVLAFDPFEDFNGLAWPQIAALGSESEEEKGDLSEALLDMHYWPKACRRRVKPPIGAASREWAEAAFVACVEGIDDTGAPPLRDALLCLDEITLWSNSRESEALQKLVLQGRRLHIRMLVACQRVSLVPGVLLSECTDMLVFRTSRPRDLDVLEEWGSVHGDGDLADLAPGLEVGECLSISL